MTDCGGGVRGPNCAESYPSLGLCLLRMLLSEKPEKIYFETFKVVACMMALVPFQFQIHLWNWRIAKIFGTACSRDGSGNGRLRTETLENFSKFRKKSGILAPLKPPLSRPNSQNPRNS